jgi:CBS domain-containing protein
MSNTITERIYDFLKNHPPFSYIRKTELIPIASMVKVQYSEKGKTIFAQGDKILDQFYVVREGAVELQSNVNDKNVLVDICDEGDIFGTGSLSSAGDVYTRTAKVIEEALVYSIPKSAFSNVLENNVRVKEFLNTSFAEGAKNPYTKYSKYKMLAPCDADWPVSPDFAEIQTINFVKDIVTCSSDTSIREAAVKMKENNVGSIIISDEALHPKGIFTDRDLRNKVVTGDVSIDEPISKIMNSPVITGDPNVTITDIQIAMIRNNIHHLCITEDGSNNSRILGLVSEHDILLIRGKDPSVFIREIQRSDDPLQLKEIRIKAEELLAKYIQQELSISYISRMMSEINSAITIRSIEIAIDKLKEDGHFVPDIPWCWLSIGSQGREEQLLRSDQDNALVFDDVPKTRYAEVKDYFLKLANHVTGFLNQYGFRYCPSKMMANNPKWCLSLSEWKAQFYNWIYALGSKDLMYSTIFFDIHPVYGDEWLADEMIKSILKDIEKQELFISLLAKNALQNPPPLSFFRNIMVENNGEHKNEFDIKARAMMPLVDGARVLILSNGVGHITNTIKRYHKLGEMERENKELYELLADQYELLIRFRAMQGLKHGNTGRYFQPAELNKMQRLMLRNSFSPIKELQSLLVTRFRLKYLG